jgi:hypothetical protein
MDYIRVNRSAFSNLQKIRVWSSNLWPQMVDHNPAQHNAGPHGDQWKPDVEGQAASLGIKFTVEPESTPPVIERLQNRVP